MQVIVLPDAAAVARAAAEEWARLAAKAARERGRFAVALAGGSPPRGLYTLLAQPEFARLVEWPDVHIFWGDERCVPPDHPDSNYRVARECLLDPLFFPPERVHRIPGELPAERAAAIYERDLRAFFGNWPTAAPQPAAAFDLILLGLGDDGHIASLFPGAAALRETERWAVAVPHRAPPAPLVDRVSLTPPALNAAAQVIFMVTGASKAERVAQVLNGPFQPEELPAQIVRPTAGRVLWLLDQAAGSGMRNDE